MPIGGIISFRPLAIIPFPDHERTVRTNNMKAWFHMNFILLNYLE